VKHVSEVVDRVLESPPAEQLLQAREHLSAGYAALDAVRGLDELEAHAVLQLRTELGDIIRRLGNVVIFAERSRAS
jgi:hypothetical protein